MQTLPFSQNNYLSASQLAQLTNTSHPLFNPMPSSNLNKRSSEQFEASCEEELQKKLKTAYSAINIPVASNIRAPMNPQQMMETYRAEMERMQHIQNFRFLLNMNQEFQKNFMNPLANKPAVKEEYVKQEETTKSPTLMASKWVSDYKSETCMTSQDNLSETSEVKAEPIQVKEPTLVEYTKAFPEWDIATIFSFLQSGKSKESFEKEKEFRAERKKRRAAKRKQLKAKEASQVKVL